MIFVEIGTAVIADAPALTLKSFGCRRKSLDDREFRGQLSDPLRPVANDRFVALKP